MEILLVDLCPVVKWFGCKMVVWKPYWKSLFMAQNVRFSNVPPSHVSLLFEYRTEDTHTVLYSVFRWLMYYLNKRQIIKKWVFTNGSVRWLAQQWNLCWRGQPTWSTVWLVRNVFQQRSGSRHPPLGEACSSTKWKKNNDTSKMVKKSLKIISVLNVECLDVGHFIDGIQIWS